jgi:hypothetical protein
MLLPEKYYNYAKANKIIVPSCTFTRPCEDRGKECFCDYVFAKGNTALEKAELIK